ncbi:hypothetical protein ACFOWE_10040 [Planomonospora corallina]|uniref:Uncharacterized protein n=1 Tax=Planomonospora corallina TaxID=1806052 RepID=A0ABV8I9Z5_9ACTN
MDAAQRELASMENRLREAGLSPQALAVPSRPLCGASDHSPPRTRRAPAPVALAPGADRDRAEEAVRDRGDDRIPRGALEPGAPPGAPGTEGTAPGTGDAPPETADVLEDTALEDTTDPAEDSAEGPVEESLGDARDAEGTGDAGDSAEDAGRSHPESSYPEEEGADPAADSDPPPAAEEAWRPGFPYGPPPWLPGVAQAPQIWPLTVPHVHAGQLRPFGDRSLLSPSARRLGHG